MPEWVGWSPLLLGAGALAGLTAGLFGIGGGFVVVPVLMFILPMLGAMPESLAHVAIGTSLATIVVTSLRSVQAHARRGAVDTTVLRDWAPWLAIGVVGGVLLAGRMDGSALILVFGVGVFLMSLHFLFPVLAGRQWRTAMPGLGVRATIAGSLGAFSSLLGIGGGTIAVIVMTLCGLSIHRSIATAAGFGTIIAIPGTLGFIFIGLGADGLPSGSLGYVNWPAALAISLASLVTAPWGVQLAHRLDARTLSRLFGFYLLLVSAAMVRKGLTGL
ncbi:MAG: sulfite exporter TauE/SafE family protein [Sphingomonadaceae bacterium]